MIQAGWLFVGFVAVCATAVAVSTQSKGAALWPNDDGVAIFSGVVGFLAWGMWAYGALDVQTVGDTIYATSNPELTYFGVAMALIPGYIALTGPAQIVRRYRTADVDEV